MTDGEAILKRSLAEPEEDVHRLAYADWLDETDDQENSEKAKLVRAGYHPAWLKLTPDERLWPTPLQREFMLSDERHTVFSGGAGCGKTEALVMAALRDATAPEYRGAIAIGSPRNLTGMNGIVSRLNRLLEGFAFWNNRHDSWYFPHGASLQVDWRVIRGRLAGRSFTWIGIDNIESMEKRAYLEMTQHLRPMGRLKPRLMVTRNEGAEPSVGTF